MLRITVEETTIPERRHVRMVLEGKLSGPWISELETTWQRTRRDSAASLTVELHGLDYVSPEGKELLCRMKRAGAELLPGGLLTRSVVDEIRGSAILAAVVLLTTPWMMRAQPAPASLRLSLHDAVALSLKQNPQVILANLSVAGSREDQNIARSALLPQVNASVSDTLTRGNVETLFGQALPGFPHHIGPFYVNQAGTDFSTPVFDLTLWRRYRSSQATVSATRAQELSVREQATLLVVSQYLGAQRSAADVQAAQSRVDLAQALYDQAADLQKAGVGTGIDTLRANVELQNESQRLIQSRTQLDTALYGLARLIGIEATRPVELADAMQFSETPEFATEQSVAQAYNTRPEMAEIRARERAASLDRKAAAAERLPSLRLTGAWSEQGLTPTTPVPVYEYGASISLPLYTGGRIAAQIAKADLATKELSEQERDLRNRISAEVETAIAQLKSARNEVTVANAGLALAREEVVEARDRFQAGVANNIEVIQAQDALARASDNQIAALYRFNQARADLAHAVGRIETLYSR